MCTNKYLCWYVLMWKWTMYLVRAMRPPLLSLWLTLWGSMYMWHHVQPGRPKRTVVPTGITKCVCLHDYDHSSAAGYSILVPELFTVPVCRKITNEGEDCQDKYGTYVSICCVHVQITLLPVSIAFGVSLRCVVLGVYHRYPVANDCIPSYNFGWPQVIVHTHF